MNLAWRFGARRRAAVLGMVSAVVAMAAAPVLAQPAPARPGLMGAARDYRTLEDVDFRPLRLMSGGVMLHAEAFAPRSGRGQKLPVIIMGHGWGGATNTLRADAEDLAQAGFLVVTFDYRGWGESDGRVILTGPAPSKRPPQGIYTTGVRELRGYIDPFEQAEDWFNVINYVSAMPQADADRIGLRGTSLSGGEVLYVAAHDPRVKAVVSQAPRIDFSPTPGVKPNPGVPADHAAAIALTQGEDAYPEPFAPQGRLQGAPIGDSLMRWRPGDFADDVKAPTLFVLASKEELVDNATNGERAFKAMTAVKKRVVLEGTHMSVYGPNRAAAVAAAADWFKTHLAAAK